MGKGTIEMNKPICGWSPVKSEASFNLIHLIRLNIQELIGKHTIVMMIRNSTRQTKFISQLRIVRSLCYNIVIPSIAYFYTCLLIIKRVMCVDVDNTCYSIAPI